MAPNMQGPVSHGMGPNAPPPSRPVPAARKQNIPEFLFFFLVFLDFEGLAAVTTQTHLNNVVYSSWNKKPKSSQHRSTLFQHFCDVTALF